MDIIKDPQLSLDFAAKEQLAGESVSPNCAEKGRLGLVLVHSSAAPQAQSDKSSRVSKIIDGVISHARSLSW